jgi:hypothetical protein
MLKDLLVARQRAHRGKSGKAFMDSQAEVSIRLSERIRIHIISARLKAFEC